MVALVSDDGPQLGLGEPIACWGRQEDARTKEPGAEGLRTAAREQSDERTVQLVLDGCAKAGTHAKLRPGLGENRPEPPHEDDEGQSPEAEEERPRRGGPCGHETSAGGEDIFDRRRGQAELRQRGAQDREDDERAESRFG